MMPAAYKRYFLIWVIALSSILSTSATKDEYPDRERIKLKNPTTEELKDLCNQSALKKLIIKGKVEGKLPECLKNLSELNELEISDVNINLDFSSIGQLKNLKILRLKHFDISELPFFVVEMKSLKMLDLSGTNIEVLPYGLDFLEKIDMRMIELNREQQEFIRDQYPETEVLFSSPCQCG